METLQHYLWGFPMLLLLMGTHVYFTWKLGFIQRKLPIGIRLSFKKDSKTTGTEGVSPYAALATALAATIGTGNIIGISTAIAVGGPGAVFWCWITGLLGIATCYSECFLSVRYRSKDSQGNNLGGPMYVLKDVLGKKVLAGLFALFCILCAFGMGSSVQSHSLSAALTARIPLSPHLIGMVVAVLAGLVLLGGVKQISKVCTLLVPLMSLFYLLACFYLLFLNRAYLLPALTLIGRSAFSSRSMAGGVAGTAVLTCIRTGVSRGLFTNEAGLGSIPMSAASSSCPSPQTQALISMTGPFWDTVVICAVTGLVIVSGMLRIPAAYQNLPMDRLCFAAFRQLPFDGELILSFSLILFAFATILGWCYYGECSARYLAGDRGIKAYQLCYLLFIYLGAVLSLDLVWGVSDLLNALMTLPNLLCLWMLRDRIK